MPSESDIFGFFLLYPFHISCDRQIVAFQGYPYANCQNLEYIRLHGKVADEIMDGNLLIFFSTNIFAPFLPVKII